jgi:hypothetical protein
VLFRSLAYPIEAFSPMRLAARFSKAQVIRDGGGLRIVWKQLGPSRNYYPMPEGAVEAEMSFRPAPNGKSVIVQAKLTNRSKASVRQVMFPDLSGLRAFAGKADTRLLVLDRPPDAPFAGPVRDPRTSTFYIELGRGYYPAPETNPQSLRRLFFFGSKGGISVVQMTGTPVYRVCTHRREAAPDSLRIMWEHKVTIEPGQAGKAVSSG